MLNVNEVKEKILTLRSGNALLAIIPEVGGCITRYCLKTEEQVLELMRPSIQVRLAAEDPTGMSCFPLIPFSNRIRNGLFSFQGKQIKMLTNFPPEVHTIHGHGWKAPWTVSEVKENRAVLAYQHFPDEWPFPYLARQVLELNGPSPMQMQVLPMQNMQCRTSACRCSLSLSNVNDGLPLNGCATSPWHCPCPSC